MKRFYLAICKNRRSVVKKAGILFAVAAMLVLNRRYSALQSTTVLTATSGDRCQHLRMRATTGGTAGWWLQRQWRALAMAMVAGRTKPNP